MLRYELGTRSKIDENAFFFVFEEQLTTGAKNEIVQHDQNSYTTFNNIVIYETQMLLGITKGESVYHNKTQLKTENNSLKLGNQLFDSNKIVKL